MDQGGWSGVLWLLIDDERCAWRRGGGIDVCDLGLLLDGELSINYKRRLNRKADRGIDDERGQEKQEPIVEFVRKHGPIHTRKSPFRSTRASMGVYIMVWKDRATTKVSFTHYNTIS